MLAVTAKETTVLSCYIQYTFALGCTDVQKASIPQGTRLELSYVPILNENRYESYATIHLVNNREIILSIVENEARLKYTEYLDEYKHLVERISLISKISGLDNFEISPLTMDDILAQI